MHLAHPSAAELTLVGLPLEVLVVQQPAVALAAMRAEEVENLLKILRSQGFALAELLFGRKHCRFLF